MTVETEICACGKALHYSDPDTERFMRRTVAEYGEYVEIRTPQGAWSVPRHYLALHGIHAGRLPSLAALHNWRRL